jgi:mannonate dehydratase
MYLGTQCHLRNETDMEMLQQLGVKHVDQTPREDWWEWTADTLSERRERLAKYDIDLEMIHIPLGSSNAFQNGAGAILLDDISERDRAIDKMCEVVRMSSEAGLRGLNYNLTILGHLRTSPGKIGRGGAKLSTFEYDKLDQALPEFESGAVDADTFWERIDHWLACIIPVAEEYKIQMACHPSDPGIGDVTYRGVARVLGMVDGLKKLVQLRESPYNGLNFCVGTISESLNNPAEEIFDIIRWFGERKKIFNVHFRNIKGGFRNFVEVFPDEGDLDFVKVLKAFQEVGYEYMIMPDHVPGISGTEPGQTAFAYTYGYIRALLQTLGEEV